MNVNCKKIKKIELLLQRLMNSSVFIYVTFTWQLKTLIIQYLKVDSKCYCVLFYNLKLNFFTLPFATIFPTTIPFSPQQFDPSPIPNIFVLFFLSEFSWKDQITLPSLLLRVCLYCYLSLKSFHFIHSCFICAGSCLNKKKYNLNLFIWFFIASLSSL